jgi:DNA-binding Xre family transcriptional regulator
MNSQHARQVDEPAEGMVYLRVAEMAMLRGVVSRTGRTPGRPCIKAIMRGTGLSYQAVYHLLRKPWRVKRLDLATLERLCAFFDCQPGDLLGFDPERPSHSRAHTETVNPLTADFRREWPTTFAQRLSADLYGRLHGYALPSDENIRDTDDELDDASEQPWLGDDFNPAEYVLPDQWGDSGPSNPNHAALHQPGVWD